MTVKGTDNVDIGCGNAFGGDDDAVDDSVEKVRASHRVRACLLRQRWNESVVSRSVVLSAGA